MSAAPRSAAPVLKPEPTLSIEMAKLQDSRDQLEQLLRGQLQKHPGLVHVRLRLLELLFESRRTEDFLRLARDHHKTLLNAAGSRQWQRIASMGRMLLRPLSSKETPASLRACRQSFCLSVRLLPAPSAARP